MEQEVSTSMDRAGFAVHGRKRAALTHTIGERDATGRLASTMAYESLSMEMTLNGNPEPAPSFDLTPPADMDPAIAAFVKGMLGALFGNRAADATLRVGETTTLPFVAGIPMSSTAGLPMNLSGQTRRKLLGISRVDGERIARLDQSIAAPLVPRQAPPARR